MKPPAARPVLYLKAGSIPDDWKAYRVVHSNGRPIRDVLEANAHEGWVMQAVRRGGELERRPTGQLVLRRVYAKIRIEKRPG